MDLIGDWSLIQHPEVSDLARSTWLEQPLSHFLALDAIMMLVTQEKTSLHCSTMNGSYYRFSEGGTKEPEADSRWLRLEMCVLVDMHTSIF